MHWLAVLLVTFFPSVDFEPSLTDDLMKLLRVDYGITLVADHVREARARACAEDPTIDGCGG